MAHYPILPALNQQRWSMYAGRDFPSPAEHDALHIEQVPEADVLVSQRVDATPRDELRAAGAFLKTLAHQADHRLPVRQYEVGHQAQTLEAEELAEVEIQSQGEKYDAGKCAAVSLGVIQGEVGSHTVAQQKNLGCGLLLLHEADHGFDVGSDLGLRTYESASPLRQTVTPGVQPVNLCAVGV